MTQVISDWILEDYKMLVSHLTFLPHWQLFLSIQSEIGINLSSIVSHSSFNKKKLRLSIIKSSVAEPIIYFRLRLGLRLHLCPLFRLRLQRLPSIATYNCTLTDVP